MSEFLRNAERILDAAGNMDRTGSSRHSVTILIDWSGAIRVVTDSDWTLQSLQIERGARLAYRVTENQGRVRVEGRSGSESCVLESSAAAVARNILHQGHAPGERASAATLPASKRISTSL